MTCATPETAETLLTEMLEWEADAFDNDKGVNGCDLVDVFREWRERMREIVAPDGYCNGCGRESLTCSHAPCADVIADRAS